MACLPTPAPAQRRSASSPTAASTTENRSACKRWTTAGVEGGGGGEHSAPGAAGAYAVVAPLRARRGHPTRRGRIEPAMICPPGLHPRAGGGNDARRPGARIGPRVPAGGRLRRRARDVAVLRKHKARLSPRNAGLARRRRYESLRRGVRPCRRARGATIGGANRTCMFLISSHSRYADPMPEWLAGRWSAWASRKADISHNDRPAQPLRRGGDAPCAPATLRQSMAGTLWVWQGLSA